jgi:hypothetical protein
MSVRLVNELDMVISGMETADVVENGLPRDVGRDLIKAFTAFDRKLEKMVRTYLKQIGRD